MRTSKNCQTPDMWTSLVEDFRVKTLALREKELVSPEVVLDYGVRCIELYGKLDLDTSIIENSPMLLVRGFERVLCDLSKTGYDAEWQCLSNAAFGFDHHRERVYVIAYSNEIKQQTWRAQKWNKAQTIFVPPPKQHGRFPLSERIYKMPDREHIGVNDGIRDWTHRVGSIGNAVNPTVAKYLFECIKIFDSNLKKDIHHS